MKISLKDIPWPLVALPAIFVGLFVNSKINPAPNSTAELQANPSSQITDDELSRIRSLQDAKAAESKAAKKVRAVSNEEIKR